MEFIEYRDPLFGIIIFLAIIAAISFASYVWNRFEVDKKDRQLKRFIKRFEYAGFDEELVQFLRCNEKPIKQMLYLASLHQKNGDHQKAIKIYLTILEHIENGKEKIEILDMLGKCYLEAGFLQRSRDIFLESLRLYPRNEDTLKHLLLIYESLNEYDRALDVCESLFELGINIESMNLYLKTLKIISHPTMPISQKRELLREMLQKEPKLAPAIFDYYTKYDLDSIWSDLSKIDPKSIIDILWSIPCQAINKESVIKDTFLSELYSAKGCIDVAKNSSIFEIDAILALKHCGKHGATLSFEYLCSNCKHTFPIYNTRCPNCKELLTLEVLSILEPKKEHKLESLL